MFEQALQTYALRARHLSDIGGILRRVGYYDAWDRAAFGKQLDAAEELAQKCLTPDNPRLAELRTRYKELSWDVMEYAQWSPEYVSIDVPLQRFRSDCAFVWQERDLNLPIHYICTYLHCKQMHKTLLELCTEDGAFGASVVPFENEQLTRDRLDSVFEIDFMRSALGLSENSPFSVLDIGSGYGRLAHRMVQCFPQSTVLCVDAVPESTFLCEYYLHFRKVNDRAVVVPLYDIHAALSNTQIHLATAINSLTECSTSAVAWWIDTLKNYRIPYLMVVPPGRRGGDGTKLFNSDRKNPPNDMVKMLIANGYQPVNVRPKYQDPLLQKYCISPTHFHLFACQ